MNSPSPFLGGLLASTLLLSALPAQTGAHHERPGVLPGTPAYRGGGKPVLSLTNVRRGPFVSIQVNIDGSGNNIRNDAANEPSIAIDPTDPKKIVIVPSVTINGTTLVRLIRPPLMSPHVHAVNAVKASA